MNESLLAYIPMDRRHAMARGVTLPDRTSGAALFADISGFTPLTEALVRELGPQRGAEELTGYLNRVYDALIDELHRWGGSAIAFAGDAVTCWFDGDDGRRAIAGALAMQGAMQAFSAVETPAGSIIELSMKAAVSVGQARRFLVGDPKSRVIDALAGATLERLAAAEHEAERGEVILAPCALAAFADEVAISEIREAKDGRQFGVIDKLLIDPEPPILPELAVDRLDEEEVRTWLLPSVYRRLNSGLGDFLAEIRPTVAVFMRFSGIEYDTDEHAGQKLDATIRAVQEIVDRYEGTLIDLNIGDKGSYLYVNFGAPLAHENNAARAASAALELRDLPLQLHFLEPLQIGISRGRMRAGAYGGVAHRTYGVLGDAVNLSARLMMASDPGTVLVSMNVQQEISDLFDWDIREPIRVKGKSMPVPIAVLKALKPRIGMHLPENDESEPLVGRDEEVAQLAQMMESTLAGQGQIVSFIGEAGLGKSRLVAKALAMAEELGFTIYGGEAESHGVNSSYLIWHPIWRGMLGLDPTWDNATQVKALQQRIAAIDANMTPRVPLFGPALQLNIPDNDLTAGLDARLRKSLLETMLVAVMTAGTEQSPTVLVLEDCHWIDALSLDLLEEIALNIAGLPVLIILTYRNTDAMRAREVRYSELPNYAELELTPLTEADLTRLASLRLERFPDQGRDSETTGLLAQRIAKQADGNPFYLEELVSYVGTQTDLVVDSDELSNLALPTSLQGLVLSRLDQLQERPKTLLKVASVVGRVFHASWLEGIYPELGASQDIIGDLQQLTNQKFTVYDPSESEDTFYFRNIITRGVIYDSLLHKMRTSLHEQTGQFLESTYAEAQDQYLDLLAYHYDHGLSEDKKRYYLRRAGEFAQNSYANQAAIEYFRKVFPLVQTEEQIEVLQKLGEVEKLVGRWDEAKEILKEALQLAQSIGDATAAGWSQVAIGELERVQGDYSGAINWLDQARESFETNANREGLAQVLHYSGTVFAIQGDLERAEELFTESLDLRREINDQQGITSLLNNLAIIAEYRSDYEGSRALHEEALAIRRELEDRRNIAYSLGNLGHILMKMGRHSEARMRLEESLTIQREIGERYSIAIAANNLGNVVRAQGEYREAHALYAESLLILKELKDGWAVANLLEDVARLAHLQGYNSDALVLFSAAGTLREHIDAPLPSAEKEVIDSLQESMAMIVGIESAKECQESGRDMSMEQAMQYADQVLGVAV